MSNLAAAHAATAKLIKQRQTAVSKQVAAVLADRTVPGELKRKLSYCHEQLVSGNRDPDDVTLLSKLRTGFLKEANR